MNHLPPRDAPDSRADSPVSADIRNQRAASDHRTASPADAESSLDIHRLRAVHRAVGELRRGTAVVLLGDQDLVILPAETAGARGLADIAQMTVEPPLLLLARGRAAAVFSNPDAQTSSTARTSAERAIRAILLSPALLSPPALRSLADPTAAQLLPEDPTETTPPKGAAEALALIKLSRLLPAAVVALAGADAARRAAALDVLCVSAADVRAYPMITASALVRVAEAAVPLEDASGARVVAFRAPDSGIEHLAILVGHPETSPTPLVRLHSECFTGDLLGSLRCDCGPQLRGAIRRMGEEGSGVLLYLSQEGRGIGLVNKLRAYALQDRGMDTIDANRALGWGADERNFLVAATMLEQLGISRVRLLTNNPDKVSALVACGVEVVSRERHVFAPNGVNDAYLATKTERFGHLL